MFVLTVCLALRDCLYELIVCFKLYGCLAGIVDMQWVNINRDQQLFSNFHHFWMSFSSYAGKMQGCVPMLVTQSTITIFVVKKSSSC